MNLATDYLGLRLRNPLVIGASPFCDDTYVARRLEDSGAAALVMRSLFEEQLDPPPVLRRRMEQSATEAVESYPDTADYQLSPERYLRQVEHLKSQLSIPVIASLNGHRPGSWVGFAERLEQAGADAIELNFYQVVTAPAIAADQVETEMLETVGLITGAVKIPVAVKLSPFHASVAQLAVALELAGAAGIVVFNRFYQPDINLDDVEVQSTLRLSEPSELLLRLRWLAILSPQLRASLAATGGVHAWGDVAKSILAGADAVHVVSVVLKHGPPVISTLLHGLQSWMRGHGYEDLQQLRGMLNLKRCGDPAAFERANYIRTLQSWKV